jgi:hypothetical protein
MRLIVAADQPFAVLIRPGRPSSFRSFTIFVSGQPSA